jgi:hypothetical protein
MAGECFPDIPFADILDVQLGHGPYCTVKSCAWQENNRCQLTLLDNCTIQYMVRRMPKYCRAAQNPKSPPLCQCPPEHLARALHISERSPLFTNSIPDNYVSDLLQKLLNNTYPFKQ